METSIDITQKITDLSVLLSEIRNEEKRLSKELSKLDLEISNYYHLFECCKFPAHVRSQINKEFDETLIKRRDIKVDIAKISSLKANLKECKTPDNNKLIACGKFKLEKNEVSQKYMQYVKTEYK